ncbi:hypothetical protein BH09ACT1_BH09ACT1_06070 [soil metagenome]
MELLFATLGGALLGLGARYSIKGRHAHGALLVPAIGAAVAAAVWAALTWAGWKFDAGWIWVVSLVVAGVVSVFAAVVLARSRNHADEAMFERLRRAAA